ncbi:hypothetical protein ACFQO7_26385 [Catellatospora aurea]|uniref:SMI1/KNR4 family protein SUKH-1 n=1 Tax=Catellatospora aurea TaxID=1337874 RepID=A0ABW2H5W6_9ACTN
MTIKNGWISFGLGRFRPVYGTYGGTLGAVLPTLPRDHPGGLHEWMRELVPLGDLAKGEYGMDTLGGPVAATEYPAALPESFAAFMADPLLRDSVPTCTSCYWEAGLPTAASPVREGARLVRFLNDRQGCVFWYLHLLPDGSHEVLAGSEAYDEYEVAPEQAAEDLWRVAPDFDEFIARFWIENLAWYELVGQDRTDDELSAPVRAYVLQLPVDTEQ